MTYRIHFEHQDGTTDSFVIVAETAKDARLRTAEELEKRGGVNSWSEEIT